jgi:hypothetical protein
MSYETKKMVESNYYGLKNGDVLFTCESRGEITRLCIFDDGSCTGIVRGSGKPYSFGNLLYILNMMRSGGHGYIFSDAVKNAYFKRYGVEFTA